MEQDLQEKQRVEYVGEQYNYSDVGIIIEVREGMAQVKFDRKPDEFFWVPLDDLMPA